MTTPTMKRSFGQSHSPKKQKPDFVETLDGDIIDYMCAPSLQHIAMTRIASQLLAHPDVMNKLDHFYECHIMYKHIKPIAIRKLHKLPIPDLLKLELEHVILSMIKELFDWYDRTSFCERSKLPAKTNVYWTVYGTVDKARTFEMAVRGFPEAHIRKNAVHFYKMACRYCLEDLLQHFWGFLSDSEKRANCAQKSERYSEWDYISYCDDFLKLYWAHFNDKEMVSSKIMNDMHFDFDREMGKSVDRRALDCSVDNPYGFRYFWTKKLTVDEHLEAMWEFCEPPRLRQCGGINKNGFSRDSLLFLLSQFATKDKQSKALKRHRGPLLRVLFRRSFWRRFLLATLRATYWQQQQHQGQVMDVHVFIESMFGLLLGEDCDTKLFKEIWYETPINLKTFFVQNISFGIDKAKKILETDDIDALIMIFEAIPPRIERQRIILDRLGSQRITLKKYVRDVTALEKLITCASKDTADNITFLKTKIAVMVRRAPAEIFYDRSGLHYDTSFEMFLNWCFVNKQEVRRFKIALPHRSDFKMIIQFMTGRDRADWTAFRKFLDWCFRDEESQNDFEEFKLCISRHPVIHRLVFRSLDKRNVAFADNLLDSAFVATASLSKRDMIRSFKNEFFLKPNGMFVLVKCLSDLEEYMQYVSKDDEGALETQDKWIEFERVLRWGAPLESCVISVLEKALQSRNNQDIDEKIKRLLDDCANKTDDENAFEARQRYVAENSISPSHFANCYR